MEGKKIIIPVHGSKSMLQMAYARKLEQILTLLGHQVVILNLDASDDSLYIQGYISNEKADMLVTIDCSGFELKLLGDDLFYNSLCIPAMHFLIKSPSELREELSERMNFTMEFYVMNDEDKQYIEVNCKRVPCVHRLPDSFELTSIEKIANGEEGINAYTPSSDIASNAKEFPQVFYDIFINAVKKRKENRNANNWDVLEVYLRELNFEASCEEKEELIAFVDLGFAYMESVELEEQVEYVRKELIRMF